MQSVHGRCAAIFLFCLFLVARCSAVPLPDPAHAAPNANTLQANPLGTTTTLSISPISGNIGSPFTLTATVADSTGKPVVGGSVVFYSGASLLGTVSLTNDASNNGPVGTATLVTRALPAGSDSVTATFAGTAADLSSTSAAEIATISGSYVTTTSLSSSGISGNYALAATVSGYFPVLPSGSISFLDTTPSPSVSLGTSMLTNSGPGYSFIPLSSFGSMNPASVNSSLATADFNGDGNLDIASCSANNVAVLLGNGDGTFQAQQVSTVTTGVNCYFVTIGDMNGDGKPDLVATDGFNVGVSLGNGDGTFSAVSVYSVPGDATATKLGDFNNDGKMDVATVDCCSGSYVNQVNILLGNGDGTLQPPTSYATGNGAGALAIGDLNQDGNLDLAIANSQDDTVSILLGIGDGTFQAQQTYPVSGSPSDITISDLNGDGKPDLAVASASVFAGDAVLVGNGDGSFQASVPYSLNGYSESIVAADVNGDGKQDLISAGNEGASVQIGNGDGTFQPVVSYANISGIADVAVAAGDINGDLRSDMIVVGYSANSQSSVVVPYVNQAFETANLGSVGISGNGTHNVVAAYSGGSTFAGSTSSPVSLAANVLAAPTFAPAGGTYTSSETVAIADASPGVTIYYTTNGTTPTAASNVYSNPLTLTSTQKLEAVAVSSGYSNSPATLASYTIAAATPVFAPSAGSYPSAQTVTISDSTPGATIYFTTNGTSPSVNSNVYSGPITVSSTQKLEAVASLKGDSNSAIVGSSYTITAAAPTFSVGGGSYTSTQTVTVSDTTAGATIYYTTNGTTPTTASTVYDGPITISQTEKLEAIAVAAGLTNSALTTASYTIVTAAPTFTPAAGTYTSAQTVTIDDATSGAVIYYTTNGAMPTTSSAAYSNPITVSSTQKLEALAVTPGDSNSSVASATYTINLPAAAMPSFTPAGGTYVGSQSVSISDSTAGATVYYTTNGTTPTTASTAYSGPVPLSSSQKLEAIAVASGFANSPAASSNYTLVAASPTFSPAAGSYTSTQSVSISDSTPGATIFYTTNGSTPTSASAVYTGPVAVTSSQKLIAIAEATGVNNSALSSATYTINLAAAAAPSFAPSAGAYLAGQSVSLSSQTTGAAIYYTTNGTTPTTSSSQYSGPITLLSSQKLEAVTVASGYSNSPITTSNYTLTTPSPTFMPAAGTYSATQSITIADALSGASIYYTTDGTTPTTASTLYGGPIAISATSQLQAIAVYAGDVNSSNASAIYVVNTTSQPSPSSGFPSNLQNLFPLTECKGNTVTDIIGGQTATVYSGQATWSADCALTTPANATHPTNRFQAKGITSFLGLEVVILPSNPSITSPNIPAAYVTSSSSFPEALIGLYPGWNAWGPTATVGNYTTYPGYQITPNYTTGTGYTNEINSQVHVLLLALSPNSGKTMLYVDGVAALNPFNPTLLQNSALAGGFLEFFGTALGYQNANYPYSGKLYAVATYSTTPTAATALQSYQAQLAMYSANKSGAVSQDISSTKFNVPLQPVVLATQGESITWGHGLSAPATQNYTYYASKLINGGANAYIANGRDGNNAYVMGQGVSTFDLFYSATGKNIALLFPNANDCKNGGTAPIDPAYPKAIPQGAVADLEAETVALHTKYPTNPWVVIWATGTSGNYGNGDTGKDSCNAAMRTAALSAMPGASTPDALFDIATDAWWGQDGADKTSANAVVCSGGPVYLSDDTHLTACAQSVVGQFYSTLVNRLLSPTTPTVSSPTYTMTGQETALSLDPSANSQTITLVDCIGLTGQTVSFSNSQASGANTVTIVPAAPPSPAGNYIAETIGGSSSVTLPNNSSLTLTAVAGADALAGCGWQPN